MRIIHSIRFAISGIYKCFISEKNFQLEVFFTIIVITAAIIFNIKIYEWLIILFCCSLMLSLELVNTAFEKLSDVVESSFHPVIKVVKDMSAAAVLISSVASLIITCVIFIPKIIGSFKIILK